MTLPAKNQPEASHNNVTGRPPDLTRQVSTQSEQSKADSPTCLQTIFSWRAAMALHMHISLVLLLMLSMNMPFALVCMLKMPLSNSSVSGPEVAPRRNVSSALEEPENSQINSTGSTVGEAGGEFEWDSTVQGLLLSSSCMLAFIMPLMVDYLSRKVDGKKLMLWIMLFIACLTMLQPVAARISPYVLMSLRLGIGFIGAAKFPLLSEVFSWWTPAKEKVTMVSLALSGMNTASILVSLTSGYLCSIPFDNGWPFIFYVQGTLTVIWCITWQFTGSFKPEEHPFISEEEKQYIVRTRFAMDKSAKRSTPPYRQILTSVPVWACLIVQAMHTYAFLIISSYTPKYLNSRLGFSLEQVGLISSVSYLVRFLGVVGWGQFSNFLMRTCHLQVTTCRKVVQCGGFYLTTACLTVLGFLRDPMLCTVLLCLVLLFQSCTAAGSFIVPLDIAPRYAGFLTGFSVTFNTFITMPGPIITSTMVQNGSMEEWRTVFITQAVVLFVGATCFLIMGSSKLQSWAVPQEKTSNSMGSSKSKERKMSVLSEGTPGSPIWGQRRFSFYIQSPANFNEAKLETNSGSLNSSPSSTANGTATVASVSSDFTSTIFDDDVTAADVTDVRATATADLTVHDRTSSKANRSVSVIYTVDKTSWSRNQECQGSAEARHFSGHQSDRDGSFTNLGYDAKSEPRY